MDWSTFLKLLPAFGPAGLVAGLGGFVIFWLLKFTIPAIQAEQKSERQSHERSLAEAQGVNRQQAKEFHESLDKIMEALQRERHNHANQQNILGLGLQALEKQIQNQTSALVSAIERGHR